MNEIYELDIGRWRDGAGLGRTTKTCKLSSSGREEKRYLLDISKMFL